MWSLRLSHPDLFHLSLWLSPPLLQVLPIFPIIPCVFIPVFSVCLLPVFGFFFVRKTYQRLFPCSCLFSCSCVPVLPGFDRSACPDPEGAFRLYLTPTVLDYWPLPALTLRLPAVLDPLHLLWITDPCLPLTCRLPVPLFRNKLLFLWHCLHLGYTWNVIETESGKKWLSLYFSLAF